MNLNSLDYINSELGYASLIVILFILPRVLLRLGIPMALTSFALGVISSTIFNFFHNDQVIKLFSTLGIVSLFLFAGLEVDIDILKTHLKRILIHLLFRIIIISILATLLIHIYSLNINQGIIFSLAIATPSTGFILNSLESSKIPDEAKFWIKLKAISAEIVALAILLVFSHSAGPLKTVESFVIIILMVLILPILLKKLASWLEKLAPNSEFGFILVLAIVSSLITKKLGAYYIVGAFLVGIITGRYKRNFPNQQTEQIIQSLRSFSTFFMPFYFFLRRWKDAGGNFFQRIHSHRRNSFSFSRAY